MNNIDKTDETDTLLKQQGVLSFFSLFTSTSTLLCCALPALFVTLGFGASLAGLFQTAPWVTSLSEYKIHFFVIAGCFIALSVFFYYKNRNLPCPADKQKAIACTRLRRINFIILIISVILYGTGAFFTFFAADLLY